MRRQFGVTGSASATSDDTYPKGFEFKMASTSSKTVIKTSSGTDCEPKTVDKADLTDLNSLSETPPK